MEKMLNARLDLILSQEVLSSSGRNVPFVMIYQLLQLLKRKVIGWEGRRGSTFSGHLLCTLRLVG
jgi:hypothetical protein